jgi:hypothetical protein
MTKSYRLKVEKNDSHKSSKMTHVQPYHSTHPYTQIQRILERDLSMTNPDSIFLAEMLMSADTKDEIIDRIMDDDNGLEWAGLRDQCLEDTTIDEIYNIIEMHSSSPPSAAADIRQIADEMLDTIGMVGVLQPKYDDGDEYLVYPTQAELLDSLRQVQEQIRQVLDKYEG